MQLTGNWAYPTEIRFGAGRIAELAQACKEKAMKNPLFVTGRTLVKLDITNRALDILSSAGFARTVFCEVDANPTEKNLRAGIDSFKAGEHDGVIAFGGGSALDLAKLIVFMIRQERPVWDFEDIGDWWKRANDDAIAPIIAVPTTAGTGSEAGRAAVLTNMQTCEKKIIFHPKMLPALVIADPELSTSMPANITAGTGMDAFAHCLESFCSPHYHPMSQGSALEGMRLIKNSLTIAYHHADDIKARTHMMAASMMGALAFQKGLGAIHALSHPIGATYNTHHGTTNAVVMLPVLLFNRPAIEDKIIMAARYLDIDASFTGFIDFVTRLLKELNIPENLTILGAVNPDIETIVNCAVKDPSASSNPVKMTRENTTTLLQSCF